MNFSRNFIELACDKGVLRFGEFVTKAGRLSPYFFNAGLFNDGASFGQLCDFYARTLLAAELPCDMLFGPAYKGIPLVAGTATTCLSASTARKPRTTAKAARWSAHR